MNILLLVGTVLGVGALALGAVMALITAAPLRAALLGALAGGWTALYAGAVIAVSLTSHHELLPVGETKYFCGFYLDCHVGVAVLGDSMAPDLGGRRASGVFHVLTLQFSSSARRETLRPWDVRMYLEDSTGRRFVRDHIAEEALGVGEALERDIAPGGSFVARVVFDVAEGARAPRLLVHQGPNLLFPEALLIGDEASLLHRKTWLALPRVT
jgi:hypothetical protein